MRFSSLTNIEPSATLAINGLAQQKIAAGERVYNLSAGEPILPPHPAIIAGAIQAVESGRTLYPPVAGIMELRQAAAVWMNTTYRTQFKATNTLVTAGGKFGIFALCQALLTPGDEALIIAPYWVSYPEIVKLFGGVPRIIKTKEISNWKLSLGQLNKLKNITKLKILFLNNASNPTGVIYSREELKNILAWAVDHNLIVISDEVYSGLVYDGGEYVSCGSFPEYNDHIVVVHSCSKLFAMTGWRVGFVFGPVDIIKVLTMLQSQSTTGTSTVGQWAALAAFQNAAEIILLVKNAMQKRRDVLIQTLKKLFNRSFRVPASSLYAFIALKDLGAGTTNSVKFCRTLIDKYNIAAVPGRAFGAEGYVRFSFGAAESEIKEAVVALKKYA